VKASSKLLFALTTSNLKSNKNHKKRNVVKKKNSRGKIIIIITCPKECNVKIHLSLD
jgi:hypothetical protein